MKLEAGRAEGFLRDPGAVRAVLIYGPDGGLVAERAVALVKAVVGAVDDAFRYSEIFEAARLLEEASAASLLGGRRVVRLRDAGEAAVPALERFLSGNAEALVILEAGELTAKSKLRALAEKHGAVVAIACYAVDAARLPAVITARLRAEGVTIESDAAGWVANRIAGEDGQIRQAVEVLTLYAGAEKRLTLDDVSAALADGGEGSIQDAIDAALTGDPAGADRAISLSFEEGISPVALVRVLLGELLRLSVLAASVGSMPVSEVVRSARPPVFFKRAPVVTKVLGLWSAAALGDAIKAALAAEMACKTTHIPDTAYCRQMFLGIASRARAAGRR